MQSARKPKFAGKKTRWEKKRIARRFARVAQGKKPVLEPLVIAPLAERKAALKKRYMVFYNGKERISMYLSKDSFPNTKFFQGIYKTSNKRLLCFWSGKYGNAIFITELVKENGKYHEEFLPNNFSLANFAMKCADLGHVFVSENLRGQAVGLKAASKGERHRRALGNGAHEFSFADYVPPATARQFSFLFEKLGYKPKGTGNYLQRSQLAKKGKFQPKDNLDEFHRIEAIDPKTGKARIFTFK